MLKRRPLRKKGREGALLQTFFIYINLFFKNITSQLILLFKNRLRLREMQQSTPSKIKKLHLIISNQSLIIHNHNPNQRPCDSSFAVKEAGTFSISSQNSFASARHSRSLNTRSTEKNLWFIHKT